VFTKLEKEVYYYHNQIRKEEVLAMKDNNKVLLSNLKYLKNLERLVDLQNRLNENKVIQDAREKQGSNSFTATNPII
jgi:cell division septal protein FtsQ